MEHDMQKTKLEYAEQVNFLTDSLAEQKKHEASLKTELEHFQAMN